MTGASLLLFAAGIASGAAYYFYRQYAQIKTRGQTAETRNLINDISRLIVLPADEQPTIATVSDPQLLKDQPFFAKAKKGDKVLIYSKSNKAILYDPVAKKILEIAPLAKTAGENTFTAP